MHFTVKDLAFRRRRYDKGAVCHTTELVGYGRLLLRQHLPAFGSEMVEILYK
jgi:hypothetical protein